MYTPPIKSNPKGKLIVFAILVIAAFTITYIMLSSMSNTGTATKSSVKLSTFTYSEFAQDNPYMQPDAGNRFVQCSFTITNTGAGSVSLNPNYFQLTTDDGQIHDYSWWVDYSMPEGLSAGASAAIVLGFEIASSATPKTIAFVPWY